MENFVVTGHVRIPPVYYQMVRIRILVSPIFLMNLGDKNGARFHQHRKRESYVAMGVDAHQPCLATRLRRFIITQDNDAILVASACRGGRRPTWEDFDNGLVALGWRCGDERRRSLPRHSGRLIQRGGNRREKTMRVGMASETANTCFSH